MKMHRKAQLAIKQTAQGVNFKIRVVPRASKNEIGPVVDGILKLRLTAPPVKGAANRLGVEVVASWLGVPKRDVQILQGEKSRDKIVFVRGLKDEDIIGRLP